MHITIFSQIIGKILISGQFNFRIERSAGIRFIGRNDPNESMNEFCFGNKRFIDKQLIQQYSAFSEQFHDVIILSAAAIIFNYDTINIGTSLINSWRSLNVFCCQVIAESSSLRESDIIDPTCIYACSS